MKLRNITIAWCIGCLVLAAGSFIPLLAQGASQPGTGSLAVALEYGAAPGCPDVHEFKAIVAGRLGYDAFSEGVPNRVLVRVASRGRAFEGRIEWQDAQGHWLGDRKFPSRTQDCLELVRAMAFALALQIQLSAIGNTSASPSLPAEGGRTAEDAAAALAAAPPVTTPIVRDTTESPPAVPASPAPPPSLPPPAEEQATPVGVTKVAPPPSPQPRPVLTVGAGTSAGFGLSPSVVASGRVFGSLMWTHWSLELAAELSWPTTLRRADGAGFTHQELLASFAACGILAHWGACLLAKGGGARIAGKDIDEPASAWGTAFEAGLRLVLRQPLGRRAYFAARAEGLLLLTRWRVSLDQHLVWTSPRFTETIGLDVGIRFP